MIHEPAYLVYTKFLALLLNHCTTVFCMSSCDENVQPLMAFFNGLNMWKSHGIPRVFDTVHSTPFGGSWTLWATNRRAQQCSMAMPSMYLPTRGQEQNHAIFTSSDRYESPQIHDGRRRAGHNGLRNRLWNSLHTRYVSLCINGDSCTNACCDFLLRNICTRQHPQRGFGCICLIHIWKPRACGDTYKRRHFTQTLGCIY